MKYILPALLLFISSVAYAGNTCGTATAITVDGPCSQLAVGGTAGAPAAPGACSGIIAREGWWIFAGTAGVTYSVTYVTSTVDNPAIAIYTGACGSQTLVGCVNATGSGNPVTETYSFTAATTTNYYIRIMNYGTTGMSGNLTVTSAPNIFMSTGSTTTCSSTLFDTYGECYSYANNLNQTFTICPSTAGQCVRIDFSEFDLEDGFDFLQIYDGNSTAAPQVYGSPFTGLYGPGVITGSATNTSGCLTLRFVTDGINGAYYEGFRATISCAACGVNAPATAQDCGAGSQVCNTTSFTGNSSGYGNYHDLTAANDGCLDGEHQSSWFYFTMTTAGTLGLSITPSVPTDYDFAVWGPVTALACPPSGAPVRCSWAAGTGATGMGMGATDLSEGATGNSWVAPIVGAANDSYILVVDNYTGSSQPFTVSWSLSGGATLGCTPLPIELLNFNGENEGSKNVLHWTTASEVDNDFFTLESSADGITFNDLEVIDGAGTSTHPIHYSATDQSPFPGNTYYRLQQTDFNGHTTYSGIISISASLEKPMLTNMRPNPVSSEILFDYYSPYKDEVSIQIFDYTGRLMKSQTYSAGIGTTTLQTELSILSRGIYSVRVENQSHSYSTVLRFVKN